MIKSIEERFKKLDDIDHVLHRPGRYIGSINPHTVEAFVYSKEEDRFNKRSITYCPGLLKVFDEVISNSVDFSKRSEGSHLDTIKVDIDIKTGRITVFDNGGITVIKHPQYNQWIPEMVFELKAGSNFNDDTDDGFGAGQNGEGASLTAIFATEFNVITADGINCFKQTHLNNARVKTEPEIVKSKKHFTEISWIPDYTRFNLEHLDIDNYDRLVKRVYDCAGCNPKLKIYLNGELIKINAFKNYVAMYSESFAIDETDTWKIAVSSATNGFDHVSFVNGTETFIGGTHIDYVANQIVTQLKAHFTKKHKVDVKPADIKNHLQLVIVASISKPRYSSQTKEQLITESKMYQTSWECDAKFIKKVLELDAIQNILDWVKAKEQANINAELRKHSKSVVKNDPKNIPKFHDATSKNRAETSLLIVEGDSALSGVLSGRDTKLHAAFPLKGKPINVFDMDLKDVMQNVEFKNLLTILGLQLGVKVESVNDVRFGKIIITTDQDLDGFNIRSLLLNMFHKYWPELYKLKMIYILNTPIVKVSFKKTSINFYSLEQFNKWKEQHLNDKFTFKYYKGLGTSSSQEWREYFHPDFMQDNLVMVDPTDVDNSELFRLMFSKEKGMANKRKDWLGLSVSQQQLGEIDE